MKKLLTFILTCFMTALWILPANAAEKKNIYEYGDGFNAEAVRDNLESAAVTEDERIYAFLAALGIPKQPASGIPEKLRKKLYYNCVGAGGCTRYYRAGADYRDTLPAPVEENAVWIEMGEGRYMLFYVFQWQTSPVCRYTDLMSLSASSSSFSDGTFGGVLSYTETRENISGREKQDIVLTFDAKSDNFILNGFKMTLPKNCMLGSTDVNRSDIKMMIFSEFAVSNKEFIENFTFYGNYMHSRFPCGLSFHAANSVFTEWMCRQYTADCSVRYVPKQP